MDDVVQLPVTSAPPAGPMPHADSPTAEPPGQGKKSRALDPVKRKAEARRKRRDRLRAKLRAGDLTEEERAAVARDLAELESEERTELAPAPSPAAGAPVAKPVKAKRPNPTPDQVKEMHPFAAMLVGAYAAWVDRSPVWRVDEASAKQLTEATAGLLAKYMPKDLDGPEGAFVLAVVLYAAPRAPVALGLLPSPAAAGDAPREASGVQ